MKSNYLDCISQCSWLCNLWCTLNKQQTNKQTLYVQSVWQNTGKKPHQRSYCDIDFTRKWALAMHLKIHTGVDHTNAATVIMLSHCLKWSYKTPENTLGRNHINVASVIKLYMIIVNWNTIWGHILVKKHIYVGNVTRFFCGIKILWHICRYTLVRNLINVFSVLWLFHKIIIL